MERILKDKTILITGGTGFLGQALTKEILKFNPKNIRIFSRDEVKHYKMQQMFAEHKDKLRFFLGDVRDFERLEGAMEGVDIAIHAAALKRLDMIEYNVEEAIKTNVLGTLNFAKACIKQNIEKGIFISTDKACSPVNTYGACKFIGERIITNMNYSKGSKKTILAVVRYGNVLESTGSVIPFFKNKLMNNEDVLITDVNMTRFFITPVEAVKLIFDAIKYSAGGEVFIPKLSAFKIMNLYKVLKTSLNSTSNYKEIGVRPGEKIHELMLNETEIRRTIDYQNRFIIQSEIENYQKIIKTPYGVKGKFLEGMTKYSSENSIMSDGELKKLLLEIGVI